MPDPFGGFTINLLPRFNASGSVQITVTAQDPELNVSDPVVFNLVVDPVNDPPLIAMPGPQAVAEDTPHFAIDQDGELVALEDFGVSFEVNPDEVAWPEWLPIQISFVGLKWDDFNADPLDFRLILTASVSSELGSQDQDGESEEGDKKASADDEEGEGSPLEITGEVREVVIDIGLLRQGKFPIVDVGSVSISVEGDAFGGEVKGSLWT